MLFILLLLISLLPFSACVTPCPPGTYRSSSSCLPCPAGTFNPFRGVGTPRLCHPCRINTFSSPGSSTCLPCPSGLVSQTRASRCQACGKGFELSSNNRCTKCERGTFNNNTAVLSCTKCPSGTSRRGSVSEKDCFPCPPGRRGSIGRCTQCPRGSVPDENDNCELCPRGFVAKNGALKCRACPPGKFSQRIFSGRCLPCEPGFESKGPGASRCRPIGATRCGSDAFENAKGDCDRCRKGFFRDMKTNMCKKCAPGSASRGGLRTECVVCPPGQVPDTSNNEICICPSGWFLTKNKTCEKCPPGTGGTFSNVFGRDGCIECLPGSFQDERGKTECKPCPLGSISTENRARRCTKCPKGTTSREVYQPDFEGATECVFLDTGCPLGTKRGRDVFGDRVCRVVTCQVGTPAKDIGVKCRPCDPGEFLENGRCKFCKGNEISPGGLVTKCKKCPNGLVRSFFDASKCACDGDGGNGKGIQDGVCKKCPPGTFSDANVSECFPCSKGFFASERGSSFCERCPRGLVAEREGMTRCTRCPKGTTPAWWIGASECLPTKA